jgi:hypothetical protein
MRAMKASLYDWFKLVQNGVMSTKVSPPTSDTVRLTIPVSREVHEVFSRYAKAGHISIGRAMGGWLQDTLQSAQFVTGAMEKARESPRLVALEIDAYARGLADETGELMRRMKAAGASTEGPRSRGGIGDEEAASPIPPSCNTGGKVPKTTHKKGS